MCNYFTHDPVKKRLYVADAFAHQAAYGSGVAAAVGLTGYTLWKRYQKAQELKASERWLKKMEQENKLSYRTM